MFYFNSTILIGGHVLRQFHLYNGKPVAALKVEVHIKDMGFLYGYSLFETILVREGIPVFLFEHLDRITHSAADLGMGLPGNCAELAAMCQKAVSCSGINDGALRLTITAGADQEVEGNCLISIKEGIPYRDGQYEKGFYVLTLDIPRNEKSPLVKHKTANYLENLLGRREAKKRGYDEGIFLNTCGQVAEGTVSNIFMVLNNEIITPPVVAGLLPGIVRQLIIEHAARVGLVLKEVNLTHSELGHVDECFLTNSLMGIMPVTKVNDSPVGTGKPGQVTREVMKLYSKLQQLI